MVLYESLLGRVSEVNNILLPTVVIPKKKFRLCVWSCMDERFINQNQY